VKAAAARPGPRGGGRNGGEVQESLSVVGVCVCELCLAGTAGRPWPAVMRRRVARTPGWCIECSDRKTASLCWSGTSRRNTPVETSPSSVVSPTAWVVICNVGELVISATSGQDRWAAAIAEKSTGCASAMAARMCRSGVASPSSGQASAAFSSISARLSLILLQMSVGRAESR
jgi:hypothetical protein